MPSPTPVSGSNPFVAPGGDPAASTRPFLLIGLGVTATTLGNPLWSGVGMPLGGLPLNLLLKETMHLDATQIASFMGIAALPWYFKPLAGLICDAVPLFGSRRRSYLLVCTAAAVGLWLVLGLIPPSPRLLLAAILFLTTAVMLASTVTGALLVEAGQQYNASGKVSALRITIMRVCDLVEGSLGGWLAGRPMILLGAFGATLHAIFFVGIRRWLREDRTDPVAAARVWPRIREQGKTILRARNVWAAAGMIVLVLAEPGFGTPLFFHQRDVMQFSVGFIGVLGTLSAAAGIGAALLYSRLCRWWSLRRLLATGIGCHVVATLVYLAYDSREAALVVVVLNGLFLTLSTLPLLDLAARSTPKGSEALGYAVIISVINLALMFSNLAGSWLYSRFGLTFIQLVWLNSGTTLVAFLAIPFLPAALVDRHDD